MENSLNIKMAARIKTAIKESMKGIPALAKELTVGKKTLYNWSSGDSLPDVAELVKFAQATGKTIAFFYQDGNNGNQNEKESTKIEDNTEKKSALETKDLIEKVFLRSYDIQDRLIELQSKYIALTERERENSIKIATLEKLLEDIEKRLSNSHITPKKEVERRGDCSKNHSVPAPRS